MLQTLTQGPAPEGQHSENKSGKLTKFQVDITLSQGLMMKVGVLGHVMPLLFGYDVTHQEADDDAAAASLDHGVAQRGPAFLGMSIERSNMQVMSCCRAVSAFMQDAEGGKRV